jgi:hypothetical protein
VVNELGGRDGEDELRRVVEDLVPGPVADGLAEHGPADHGEGQHARLCQQQGRDPYGVGQREVLGLGAVVDRDAELLGEGAGQDQDQQDRDIAPGPARDIGDADGDRPGGKRGRNEDEPPRPARKLRESAHHLPC